MKLKGLSTLVILGTLAVLVDSEMHIVEGIKMQVDRIIGKNDVPNINLNNGVPSYSQKTETDEDIYEKKRNVDILISPGDTYGSIINRIKNDIFFQSEYNRENFPNLYLFSDFNDFQQRKFFQSYIKKAKKRGRINSKDFFNGVIYSGDSMSLDLASIDEIIYTISNESYSPIMELEPADEFAINLVVKLEQNNNLLKNLMCIENYIPVGSNGYRRKIKQILEDRTYLQYDIDIGLRINTKINSHGDYQMRLTNLNSSLDSEWPNKSQLLKAFSYLDTAEFKSYFDKNSRSKRYVDRVNRDLEIVSQIKTLLEIYDSANEETKQEYRTKIIEHLESVLVLDSLTGSNIVGKIIGFFEWLLMLDDGTGSNIVGKIIGTSLMNDKLNLHFQKLNGILQASGENLDDIYNDRQKMQSYENIIILINNLGETNVVYGLAENYIIRILKNLEKVVGKEFDYPELETTAMLGHFVYGTEAFNNHIDAYRIILLQIYSEFIRFYKKGNLEHESIYLVILELKDMIDGLLEKKGSLNKVYDLLKNQKLKEGLLTINKGKSGNLVTYALPLDDELSGTPFRDTFFRYINQRHLKRKGPGVKK